MEIETLVFVDDEQMICDLSEVILTRAGYNVIYTGDSRGADKLLGIYSDDIALLITDVRMGHITGMELYERYRTKYPDIKVICITGNPNFAGIEIINQDPKAMVLEKPFSQSELLVLIRGFLDT